MEITLNEAQSLYVFHHDDGYTTRGFDSLFKETNALAKRLKQPAYAVSNELFGSMTVWHHHQALIELARDKDLGTWFHADTPQSVRKVIEKVRRNEMEIRLFYGDPITGGDWLEEFDVIGKVSRSTGPLKVPLLVKAGECGGPAMLDHCIVRMVDTRTGRELYRHLNYHHGVFTAVEYHASGYAAEVRVDGKTHARFKSMDDAFHWMAFMVGKSFLNIH